MSTDAGASPDDSVLADWFDEFVEDVLEGRPTDLDSRIEQRPELANQITESYLLAHRLAGRRLPTTPRIEGYEVVRELGRGGMGAVFLAKHVKLGRMVALKVMPTTFGLSERARIRFMSEVRALATLTDDHIVRVHNVISNDEALAFEMEYIDGPTLRAVVDRIRRRGRDASLSDVVEALGDGASRPPERTLLQWSVRIVATIARALGRVHATGLVHRDVKPSNILLRRDGTPLLADFGLVRETASSVTRTEAFVGTLAYASPEQLHTEGAGVDARSDVYSLGATLWELVVGVPPQEGRSAVDVLRQIEVRGAPRLRQHVPSAPRDLETILEKALDVDPDRRYATIDAFADDLELLLRWQPIHARPPGPLGRLSRVVRRNRGRLVAASIGAAVVVVALVAALLFVRERERRTVRVDDLVRIARERLISTPSRDRSWRVLVLGNPLHSERLNSVTSAPSGDLTGALVAYDEALSIEPDRADVRIERTVVAVAAGLPGVDVAGLPPLTKASAETLLRGALRYEVTPAEVIAAAPDDRFALGLLSFLICDVQACETVWAGLESRDADSPLRDAGLGLLQAIDGWPERAYPRLLQATRALPNNALLATLLAEVASSVGEREAARRWLARAEELGAAADDTGLVEIALAMSAGDIAGARAWAARLDSAGARTTFARARIELADGKPRAAREILTELVARSPRLVHAHLSLARIALATRSTPELLQQVEWVVDAGFCADRSPGAFRDAAEILQLSGLSNLVARAGSARGAGRGEPHRNWVEASLSRGPFEDPVAIELLIERRAASRRDHRNSLSIPTDRSAPFARSLASAAGTCLAFPELLALMRPLAQVATIALAFEIRDSWSTIVRSVLPRLVPPDASGRATPCVVRRWTGDAPGDRFGMVGAVGDLDGDGTDDFVGYQFTLDSGRTRYMRAWSGATGELVREFRAVDFGYAAVSVGDVDRDGTLDLAISSIVTGTTPDRRQSEIVIVSGASGAALRTLRGRPDDTQFGTSMQPLPDFDGDGVMELAVGSSGGLAGAGYVTVFSTSTGAELGTTTGTAGSSFAMAMTSVGDRDGDGIPELAISAPAYNNGEGMVAIISPRDGHTIHQIHGDTRFTMLGWSLCGGADFDGDGIDDLAVGIPFHSRQAGAVAIYSGRDDSRIALMTGEHDSDSIGMSLDVCDLDGDGVPDVVAGAPLSRGRGKEAGRVCVFSGAAMRAGGTVPIAAEFQFAGPGDLLGMTLATLPDHFGPGRGAIVTGSSGDAGSAGTIFLLQPFPDLR